MRSKYHNYLTSTNNEVIHQNSHAVGYINISYRCLWLKTHFPAEWWAAVNFGASYTMPAIYPKNRSFLRFIGRDGDIVFARRVRARPQVISPMNYIEKTGNWLNTIWKVQLNKKTRKVGVFTR